MEGMPDGLSLPLETLVMRLGFRVAALGEAVGLSQRQLHTVFIRDVGVSPKQWCDQQRMVVARRMLHAGCLISEVSKMLGYSTEVAFTRRFTSSLGLPPGRFARKIGLRRG